MYRKIDESGLVCEIEDGLYAAIEETENGCSVSVYNGFEQIATQDVDSFDVFDALDVAVDLICSRFPEIDRACLRVQETDPEWLMSRIAD